jgi:hypothetical protein
MPRIFVNTRQSFLYALRETLENSDRADFCVGYVKFGEWRTTGEHPGG